MICSLEREPLLLSFSFLFCLGVFTSHFHLQVQNYTAAVFLTNPTLPGKMSLFYLKCQCQNYLAVGKNRAKLKKTSLALFILEFRFFSLTSKKIISSKHSPIEEPDTVFPLYGTETGNHVSQVLGENYTGCYTEAKCQCPLAQAIKLTLIRKPTESLRIICHYKALRYTHFIFLRQRRVGTYLLVVFPRIHSFMKLIGLQLLNLHSGDLLLQILIYYK